MAHRPHVSFRTKLIAAFSAALFLIVVGTVVYCGIEGWNVIDSMYFTVMTLTTIGYGDFVPTHVASKIFTMFFAFSGIGIFLFAMMTFAEHYFTERAAAMEKKFKRFSVKAIEKISPELKEPTTRRGFFRKMPILTKADLRAKREEAKKKKSAKR